MQQYLSFTCLTHYLCGSLPVGLSPLTACVKAVDACAKASASAHGGASFSEGAVGKFFITYQERLRDVAR